MSDEIDVAVHEKPVWRDRSNYILQADLSGHGMPGRFEQLWARDLSDGTFELCCLPFFTYGYALGDIVRLQPSDGRFGTVLGPLVSRSERDLLRVAFQQHAVDERHEQFHSVLASSGRPHEWLAGGLVSIDVVGAVPDDLRLAVNRLAAEGVVEWEWGRELPGQVTFPNTQRK